MKINIFYKIYAVLFFQILYFSASAQNLRGIVMGERGDTLAGAFVMWADNSEATTTDNEGVFELPKKAKNATLIIRFVGHEEQKIEVLPNDNFLKIKLKGSTNLSTVIVQGQRGGNTVSTIATRHLETISQGELLKDACCNLSESFERNGSVDVSYQDGVTGAKEIQMLGLRGIYTQLLVENRPALSGLATPYALEYLPGTWLESIQISKGAGSVVNGFSAMTGSINSEIVKPAKDKPIFVNVYADNFQRFEGNLHLNKKFSPHFSSGLLLHGNILENEIDHNGDGFLEMPLKKQINAMWRNFYESDLLHAQFSVQGISENRRSGTLSNLTATPQYRVAQQTNRVEAFAKLAYKGFSERYRSLGSQWSGLYHDLQSAYGSRYRHNGTQRSFYGNVMYNTIFSTTDHKISTGASFQYDDFQEFLNENNLSRTDKIVGAYAEYTYSRPAPEKAADLNDLVIIAAARADYFNRFGLQFVPRLNVKYNFSEDEVIRFAAGRGVRVANVLAENIYTLITNRNIQIANDLRLEDAWNFGLNYVKTWEFSNTKNIRLSADIFHTTFENQIVTDFDSDASSIKFYNLVGKSYSNSALVMLNVEGLLRGVSAKAAYKFNDVRTDFGGTLRDVPLVPRHRTLLTVDYETPNKRLMINTTWQWIGNQRIVINPNLPAHYHNHFDETVHETLMSGKTPSYSLFNAQITYRPRENWSIYLGAENLGSYTQHTPIIAADNPESPFFDATQLYAPMMGRRIYMGFRWHLNE